MENRSSSRSSKKKKRSPCLHCERSKKKLSTVCLSTFYGPTLDETILQLIAALPYDIGVKLGIQHKDNEQSKLDLTDWLDKSCKELALRVTEEKKEENSARAIKTLSHESKITNGSHNRQRNGKQVRLTRGC